MDVFAGSLQLPVSPIRLCMSHVHPIRFGRLDTSTLPVHQVKNTAYFSRLSVSDQSRFTTKIIPINSSLDWLLFFFSFLSLEVFSSLRRKALPCGMASGLDIGLSNTSLKTVTLSFYSSVLQPFYDNNDVNIPQNTETFHLYLGENNKQYLHVV